MSQRRDALNQSAEKLMQRRGVRIEIDKDETLPSLDANRNQAILRAVEIFDAFELGHAFQRSVEAVVPAVVRTMQHRGLTARLRDDGGGVVAANVVESAKDAVSAAHNDDWFSGDDRGDELAWLLQLIDACHQLPGLTEDVEPFQFRDAWIDIPGSGNG